MRLSKSEIETIARAFVDARCEARILDAFPLRLPEALEDAIAVQEQALALTGETVAGWKVAMIAPHLRDVLGHQRLAGPIDRRRVHRLPAGGAVDVAVFDGGRAVLEAEFVVVLGDDLLPGPDGFTPERVLAAVASINAGVEVASSPLPSLDDIGPLAVTSDRGNNSGVVVGPQIDGWRDRPLEDMMSRMFVDGVLAGEGSAARVPGGPLGATLWLAGHLATRGRTLRAGDVVSTGMTTGAHVVRPGMIGRIEFSGAAPCDLRVEAVAPGSMCGESA